MSEGRNKLSVTAAYAGDRPGIRRRDDDSIDIEYYECRTRQLRSQYITGLLVRFFGRWRRRSVRLERGALDARTSHDIGVSQSEIPAIASGAYFRDAIRRQRRLQTDSFPNQREMHPMYERHMLTLMADHNRWMNEKLYAVCARMSDDERKRDLGAFFRSIHGTFNHLLLVDRLWLGRILGQPFAIESLEQELYTNFDTLTTERSKTDAGIESFVATLESKRLAEPIHYTSFLNKQPVTLPLGLILVHLFHHQTHHRGQITTLISQLGHDFGDTDLIYMPGAATAYFDAIP